MQRLARKLPKPANKEVLIYQSTAKAQPRPQTLQLLPSTIKYLDTLQKREIPLLPAPPSFEAAFAPFEPMFHTVFYRKYPAERLADAKQDALLHLWKLWKADMRLFDQSAAYVVQAAIWGASPTRKIQKEKHRQERELPMLDYTRYIDVRVAHTSRDPAWMERTDLRVDIQYAIRQIRQMLQSHERCDSLFDVLQDIVCGRSRTAAGRTSPLGWRAYGRHRDRIEGLLREVLAAYKPQQAPAHLL